MPRPFIALLSMTAALLTAPALLAQDKGAASLFLPGAGDFAQALPLTARGNEPGWVLTLTTDGAVLSEQSGERTDSPLPAAEADDADILLRLQGGEVVRLSPHLCRDSMTGMPYPLSVTVERAADALTGCGGDPLQLLAGDWHLTALSGTTLPEGAEITLSVAGDRVSGRSACNRYSGGISAGGESITFSQMAGTRMACPAPLMQAETSYLAALGRVSGFDLDESGALTLLAGDDPVATFTR